MELNKKEYLPLFYLASAYNYAIILNDFETGCIEANKVVESAKIANASKFPVFTAYMILMFSCPGLIDDQAFLNEFEKIKGTLTEAPEDLKILQGLYSGIGTYYLQKDQYPKALTYLQEGLRLSEDVDLIDAIYAGTNEMLALPQQAPSRR